MVSEDAVIVDIVSLGVVALLVVLGWRSGALRQILRLVAVVAVVVGAPFLSPQIREMVFGEAGRASPGIEVVSIFLAGVAIYVAFALGGWMFVRVMRLISSALDLVDRLAGAAIGGVKGVLIAYLMAALIVMLEGPIRDYDPENRLGLVDGRIATFVSDYNVLAPWQFPDLDRLHEALRIGEELRGGDVTELPEEGSAAEAFLEDERVVRILGDDSLMEWVRQDHYPMTLADADIRSLLNDEEMVERLELVNWQRLDRRVEELDEAEGEQ